MPVKYRHGIILIIIIGIHGNMIINCAAPAAPAAPAGFGGFFIGRGLFNKNRIKIISLRRTI
jgi:hypothetical protein